MRGGCGGGYVLFQQFSIDTCIYKSKRLLCFSPMNIPRRHLDNNIGFAMIIVMS